MPTRLAPLLAALLGTGCATMVRGSYQYVSAETQPAGATFRAGAASCTTPCALRLPRNRSYVLELEKPGYERQTVPVYSQVDGLAIANVCLPPLFFLWGGVDVITGAAFELSPSRVDVALRPEGPAADEPAPPEEPQAAPAPGDDDSDWKTIPPEGTEI